MSAAESRYAEALLNAASCPETANKIEGTLSDFSSVLSNSEELQDFLFNPVISASIKKDTMRKIFPKDTIPVFVNFISLLVDKGRLTLLPVICEEFGRLKDLRQKNLDIHVYSAQTLEEDQLLEIREKYRKQYGAVSAEIHPHIDSALLGGVRIQIGDISIDNTLFGRLNGMLSALEI